ncbi:MAG: hypothetical protein M3540_10645 [Actinomycetota bacterium]|nr:hypothetical protein [Actinomycetota bacterium]
MIAVLAHGIGGVKDLPIPGWLFLYGAAVVLIVSFAALAVLWKRSLLDEPGRPAPAWLDALARSRALRVTTGTVSLFLFAVVLVAALIGGPSTATNIAPVFVWVIFALLVPALSVLVGNIWALVSPWRAAADAVAWLAERAGLRGRPVDYPDRLGLWPAAALLFAFTALELVYPDASNPRVLAVAIVLYSWVAWLGMLTFGREAWLRGGEAFAVYFRLLSRLAPLGLEDGRLVLRRPLAGVSRQDEPPGTIAIVAVMLGSVAFDGFQRTSFWQDRTATSKTLLNFVGLTVAVAVVALTFLLAVRAAQVASRHRAGLAKAFAGSLIPIAFAYVVAHYFSLVLGEGQRAIPLASDPFGRGWDLFGTADFQLRLQPVSPNTIWYVQCGALVIGHVLGLAVAHDRAVGLFASARTATLTQVPLLALMVLYTVGGLWLLSSG